jgi:hypothetical protein
MPTPNNDNLLQVRELAARMLELAELGDRHRDDASCGILYGILRDTAYRLRKLADEECEKHRLLGKWQ